MAKDKEYFFLIRGKINPESILLVRGKILSEFIYLDTIQYRIRILEFRHISFLKLKKMFVGERYLSKRNEMKLYELFRNNTTINDLNNALQEIKIFACVDKLYVFKSPHAMTKAHNNLQKFYLRKHIKAIGDIISAPNYNGAFKMTLSDFHMRFRSGFIDTYKESFNDKNIDDYLKNL